ARQQHAAPGFAPGDARREQEAPRRRAAIGLAPARAEAVAGTGHGLREGAVPGIDEFRRQPPLDEVAGPGQLAEIARRRAHACAPQRNAWSPPSTNGLRRLAACSGNATVPPASV